MLKLWKRNRADGGSEHQEAVKSRVRNLTSVTHDLTVDDSSAEEIRNRLKGGRSHLAHEGGRPTH